MKLNIFHINFIPIADITYLHHTIVDNIKKESLDVNGIMYAPPIS